MPFLASTALSPNDIVYLALCTSHMVFLSTSMHLQSVTGQVVTVEASSSKKVEKAISLLVADGFA
jgi:hypothetical protein